LSRPSEPFGFEACYAREMRFVARTVLGVLVVLASCKPPDTPKHPEYVDQICQAQCYLHKQCDATVDAASCVNRCKLEGSPRRVYDRDDYVKSLLSCLKDATCEVKDGKELAGPRCRRTVRDAVQPTPLAVERCKRKVVRFDECDFEETYDDCIKGTKLYADAVLHELDDCLTHQCNRIGNCFTAVVGEDEGVKKIKKK
jgi:hypothetical protein